MFKPVASALRPVVHGGGLANHRQVDRFFGFGVREFRIHSLLDSQPLIDENLANSQHRDEHYRSRGNAGQNTNAPQVALDGGAFGVEEVEWKAGGVMHAKSQPDGGNGA